MTISTAQTSTGHEQGLSRSPGRAKSGEQKHLEEGNIQTQGSHSPRRPASRTKAPGLLPRARPPVATRLGNVTQESTALAAAYAAALAELRGLPAPSYLKAGGRRRPRSGPGLPARVARRRLRLRVRLARRWLREPAMNQPDSIQKSCPGLRREALPGSPPCLGFRSPDGQSETTREPGERPGRMPGTDGAGRPPRRTRLGSPGGSERRARSRSSDSLLSLPPRLSPTSARSGGSRDLGRRPARSGEATR